VIDHIRVFDDFVPDPAAYRRRALELEYRSYEFPEVNVTFHGIAQPAPAEVPLKLVRMFPDATPTLSFFRRSPLGQQEPHFIHTDADMGDWTALVYLNPQPPEGDGTAFWRYRPTGEIANSTPHARSAAGMTPDPALWTRWRRVSAKFNRLVLFPATYLHSRAIFDNWGGDNRGNGADDVRLTQVTFGKGAI
jgi:hypothetical protein